MTDGDQQGDEEIVRNIEGPFYRLMIESVHGMAVEARILCRQHQRHAEKGGVLHGKDQ